nr:MAG TPA: hypothetical protein [Caudoviricetes sp.]
MTKRVARTAGSLPQGSTPCARPKQIIKIDRYG